MTDPAARWSALHHGIDPRSNPVLWAWLRLMWALARPVAWLPPLVITVLGAGCAVAAAVVAADLPALAAVLVLLAVLCDGLDGAVAILTDRASRFGEFADKAADRVADVAFAVALWQVGAPVRLVGLAAGLSVAQEFWREVGPVRTPPALTVNERPSRAICTVLGLAAAATVDWRWPVTLCAAVWAVLAVIGAVQLAAQRGGQLRPGDHSSGSPSAGAEPPTAP